MKDLMNNPGSEEAERQWWVIEFEIERDPAVNWVTDPPRRKCATCQCVLQRERTQSNKRKGAAEDGR